MAAARGGVTAEPRVRALGRTNFVADGWLHIHGEPAFLEFKPACVGYAVFLFFFFENCNVGREFWKLIFFFFILIWIRK